MYDAMDIAEYVLYYCDTILDKPIDNLKLQKFLYYIQGEYLAKYDEPIFDNPIEAWTYGASIPDVYYSYNSYSSLDITRIKPTVELSDKAKTIIKKVVNSLIDISIWKLVEKMHKEPPWYNNYNPKDKREREIPIADIREWFIHNN